MIPTNRQAERRLRQILARGSANLGEKPDCERLMLMVTRDCELRCAYCFVDKTDNGPVLPADTVTRAIDLMMSSRRSRLELQLFGGEPSRAWDRVQLAFEYARDHPERRGRHLQRTLTSNGLNLDPARIAWLEDNEVLVLFSLDGDAEAHRRFRAGPDTDGEHETVMRSLALLRESRVDWFMNAVLAPASAGEVWDRYAWALEQGVPALQLNYAVGMAWKPEQERAYLEGLERVLRHHHTERPDILLYNWRSDCEPVMLSDDLIVDVDGTILHDGAIFLERSMPALKRTYRRGHLDEATAFDPLRWDLATLCKTMVETWPEGHKKRAAAIQNIRMGAAVDLLVLSLRRELGRP
jgi:MoaA/NifB/PqqE/SkfB family radical SAM enzyme